MYRLLPQWTGFPAALALVSAALLMAASHSPARAEDEKVSKLVLKEGSAKEAGKLESTDAKDEVRKQLCKLYAINLKGGQSYQIDMTSKDIDPFLRLEDAKGMELANDDDGGGFPNARIVFACPKDGTY